MYKPSKPAVAITAGVVLTPVVIALVQDPANSKKLDLPPTAAFAFSSTASVSAVAPMNTITDEQLRGLETILKMHPVVQKPRT